MNNFFCNIISQADFLIFFYMYMFAIPKFMKTLLHLYTFHTVVSLIIEQTSNVKNSDLEQKLEWMDWYVSNSTTFELYPHLRLINFKYYKC